jgi:dihydrofolate reductase
VDLARFRDLTVGHAVIMGRRTHESIGRPLPGRRNIVLSRRPGYAAPGCEVFSSLEAAVCAAKDSPGGDSEVFVIGGAEVYRRAIPLAGRLYLTLVDDSPAGADAFFPDPSAFAREISRESVESAGHRLTCVVLEKDATPHKKPAA